MGDGGFLTTHPFFFFFNNFFFKFYIYIYLLTVTRIAILFAPT